MKTYFENMIDNVLFRLTDTGYGIFRLTASEIGEDGNVVVVEEEKDFKSFMEAFKAYCEEIENFKKVLTQD